VSRSHLTFIRASSRTLMTTMSKRSCVTSFKALSNASLTRARSCASYSGHQSPRINSPEQLTNICVFHNRLGIHNLVIRVRKHSYTTETLGGEERFERIELNAQRLGLLIKGYNWIAWFGALLRKYLYKPLFQRPFHRAISKTYATPSIVISPTVTINQQAP